MGVYAREKGVDELYCTGPLSKETADGFNGKWYETKDEIYEVCKPLLEKDCIIMIKGSRAMKMDTLVDAFRGKTMSKLRLGVVFGDKVVNILFHYILSLPFYVKFMQTTMK